MAQDAFNLVMRNATLTGRLPTNWPNAYTWKKPQAVNPECLETVPAVASPRCKSKDWHMKDGSHLRLHKRTPAGTIT